MNTLVEMMPFSMLINSGVESFLLIIQGADDKLGQTLRTHLKQ